MNSHPARDPAAWGLRVRLISPWSARIVVDDMLFDTAIPADEADALLCYWAPSEELFTFPRRKAWYCCEPWCQFRGLGGGTWPAIRARLAPHEFLCHNHSDLKFRVPHVTHFQTLDIDRCPDRLQRAIAIVSNHGGHPLKRHRDLTYRNHLVTHPLVDLFGRSGWVRYRSGWFSRARVPANYRGELSGDWPAAEKRLLMARYKVAVCLENMGELQYFTEKFVEAVCAGCVPVYRAHVTVAETVLKGARWVDPADFDHSGEATLEAALACNHEAVIRQNALWLTQSSLLQETSHRSVLSRIGSILASTPDTVIAISAKV